VAIHHLLYLIISLCPNAAQMCCLSANASILGT